MDTAPITTNHQGTNGAVPVGDASGLPQEAETRSFWSGALLVGYYAFAVVFVILAAIANSWLGRTLLMVGFVIMMVLATFASRVNAWIRSFPNNHFPRMD